IAQKAKFYYDETLRLATNLTSLDEMKKKFKISFVENCEQNSDFEGNDKINFDFYVNERVEIYNSIFDKECKEMS
ncbi:hypothetical protein, partial [Flavobacterium sp.]|uniref:hypothetical protein n=1 Tax=Flavobacterium sp. TaxID=239 RepID=UPI00375084F6